MRKTSDGAENGESCPVYEVQSPIPGLGPFSQMVLDTLDFTHQSRHLPILLVTSQLTRYMQIRRQPRPIQAHQIKFTTIDFRSMAQASHLRATSTRPPDSVHESILLRNNY